MHWFSGDFPTLARNSQAARASGKGFLTALYPHDDRQPSHKLSKAAAQLFASRTLVMPGLVPGIHVLRVRATPKSWMART
jgi:hypothetical protein